MKHRDLFKGIIALSFVLCFFALSFLMTPAKASAADDGEPKLNVTAQSLVRGKSFNLRLYNLADNQTATYKSSNSEVATVSSSGIVSSVQVGTCYITVTVKEGRKTVATLSCKITVGPPAIFVRLTREAVSLTLDSPNYTLQKIVLPSNTAEQVKFISLDPSIVSVSSNGKLTAKAVGSTTVYAMLDNGYTTSCTVSVSDSVVPKAPSENADFETFVLSYYGLLKGSESGAEGDNTSTTADN